MDDFAEFWADRFAAFVVSLFVLIMFGALGCMVALIAGCTVSYEPETKACLLHFSPSGEQIRAVGEVCMKALSKVHDEPASVEVEDVGNGI